MGQGAVVLPVARDEQFRRAPAESPRRGRRHRARIDRIEVAARGQHIGPPAGRRAGRPGSDETPVETCEQAGDFRVPAAVQRRAEMVPHIVERGGGGGTGRAGALDQAARVKLDALHRIAAGTPRVGAGVRQRGRARALPRGGHIAIEGVEIPQPQVFGDGARKRRRLAAGQARERRQQVRARGAGGRFAEDMQAVADLHFLELAQVVVDPRERLVGAVACGDAAVAVEAEAPREVEDFAAEQRQPARVDPRGLVILVDKPFQFRQRAVALGAGHGRGEVVDDDCCGAAFGLASLAGVIDDEGVEMRQRPEGGLGETLFRQRDRLAGQPFEIAVLAEMDDGVSVERLAQPDVEREIGVRRNEVGVVIGGGGVETVAARRLHADRYIAELHDGEAESAVGDAGIGFGRPPSDRSRRREPLPAGGRKRGRRIRQGSGRRGARR